MTARALLIEAEQYQFVLTPTDPPRVLGVHGERPLTEPIVLRERRDLAVAHNAVCRQLQDDAYRVADAEQMALFQVMA